MPSPELIRHARQVYSPPDPKPQAQYLIDDIRSRDFTPDEEKELDALGYRNWADWAFANWGTNQIAFEVELDESTVDLGYVVIHFETAWSPPVRILERLREMFPEIAFCCHWFAEDEFFDRYDPSRSRAIARSEQEPPSDHVISTLYLTNPEYPEFFLETRATKKTGSEYPHATSTIEPMTPESAHLWMLAPVKLLTLFCPELPTRQTEAVGSHDTSAQSSDQVTAEPDYHNYPDDVLL